MNAPAPTELLKLADGLKAWLARGDEDFVSFHRTDAKRIEAVLRQAASVERAEARETSDGGSWENPSTVERAEVAGEADAVSPRAEKKCDCEIGMCTHRKDCRQLLASPPRSEGVRASEVRITAPTVDQIADIVSDYYDEDNAGRWRKCAQHIADSFRGAAQAQTGCDDTDHVDWDAMAEKRLDQSPVEHGRHIPQTSPAPGCDSGSLSAQEAQQPRWTEDELALAFFDYDACKEDRCKWTQRRHCQCRSDAYRMIETIKHVLPNSLPLQASTVPSAQSGGAAK